MTEIALGSGIIIALLLLLTLALLAARSRLIPQGGVTVAVNEDTKIEAKRGETLLSALHRTGIAIPAGCGGNGTCGLCRVTATGPGAGEAQATERGVLSAAERRAHVRLACQLTLRGPVDVALPDDLLSVETLSCRVLSNRMMAPLITELVVALPDGHEIDFHAGSFMQITAPPYRLDFSQIKMPDRFAETWRDSGWQDLVAQSSKPVSRAYSIASRPEDRGKVVFNIRLAVPPPGQEANIPPGIVSSHLFALKPGDQIDLSGPYGEFHAQPTTREMVFIGGGVGMAPLRAMIHEQAAMGVPRKMTYFYGARSAIDLFYTEEFDAIAAQYPDFTFIPALSDPAPGDRWTGATGFIHETVRAHLRHHPAPEECEYYLCGPPVMISAVIATLLSLGVERGSIFNDDFGA